MTPTNTRSLLDEFLPVFDVSDTIAITVNAPLDVTWRALMDVDFLEVGRRKPLTAVLGGVRALPELLCNALHGIRPKPTPRPLRLRDLAVMPLGDGGWVLLGDRPADEIALGLVGKFWLPVITFKAVAASQFAAFNEPGFAKTIYALSVRPMDACRTQLSATMRTATTDDHARRWFGHYWTLGVGSGARVLVESLLEITRDHAEAAAKG